MYDRWDICTRHEYQSSRIDGDRVSSGHLFIIQILGPLLTWCRELSSILSLMALTINMACLYLHRILLDMDVVSCILSREYADEQIGYQ